MLTYLDTRAVSVFDCQAGTTYLPLIARNDEITEASVD